MEYCKKCDIVHDVYDCPLCEANEKIGDLESKIDELEDEISDLKREGVNENS